MTFSAKAFLPENILTKFGHQSIAGCDIKSVQMSRTPEALKLLNNKVLKHLNGGIILIKNIEIIM